MVSIEDFTKFKYLDYGKVFLVLYFKGFSWDDELKSRFKISIPIIRDALQIMIKNDLVIEYDYESLDFNLKNNMWEFNQLYYKLHKNKPKIYVVNEKIKETDGYFLFEALKKESKYNNNLKFFIKKVLEVSQKNSLMGVDDKEFEEEFKDIKIDYELEEIEYMKVLLVLLLKGFSWQKELENEFNISSSAVKKAIKLLENKGFIVSKDFYSLDLDSQECIRRLSGAYSNLIRTHPKVYTLSLEGREFAENNISKLEDEAKVNSSLQATVEFIKNKSLGYQKLKNKFNKEEKETFLRKRIDSSTGFLFETETLRTKDFKNELKLVIEEFKRDKILEKSELGLLTNSQKKYLTKVENKQGNDLVEYVKEKNIEYNKKSHYLYNGKEISPNDFEKIIEENNKDKKKINKYKSQLTKTEVKSIEKDKYNLKHSNNLDNIDKYNLDILNSGKYDFYKNNIEETNKINSFVINRQKKIIESLELSPKNIEEKREEEAISERILNIIEMIKEKGWMDYFAVQRLCKNEKNFNFFQEIATKYNIYDVGEDFKYISK